MSNIKKFNSFNENHDGDIQNYMFFGNLKTIKRLVDKILEMDEAEVDEILKEHNWALDHITSSKDDIEEVFNFLAGDNSLENESDDDIHLQHRNMSSDEEGMEPQMVKPEDEESKNIKGFEDFK
jgi:hypothetical protein